MFLGVPEDNTPEMFDGSRPETKNLGPLDDSCWTSSMVCLGGLLRANTEYTQVGKALKRLGHRL